MIEEVLTKVPNKYINFADIFSLNLVFKLSEHTKINNQTIELFDVQHLPYRLIYSLRPVELETMKTYIKTNLANKFIRPSKSPASTLILFN